MDKDTNIFDIDDTFDSLFGDDLQGTKKNDASNDSKDFDKAASNNISKESDKTISINTNIEIIFKRNISDLGKGHPHIDDRLMKECNYLVEHDIPEINKKNVRFNCDEFSIFFAALCAIYYKFYISKLCGNKGCNGKMVKVKSKLVQCLKMLTQEYKELYNDEKIDSFVSHFDSYKDSWHKKKASALKKFALKQKSSDEDFPFVLFSYCFKFFDYEESPIVKKELYRISLFCAYHSNINLIYKNANDFFLDKLIKNKQESLPSPDNLRLIVQKSSFTDWYFDDTRNFKSLFWNLDDIVSVLNLDHSIVAQKVRYYNDISGEKENPRKHFVKQEKSIIELIKRCFGKSFWEYGTETESTEQVTTYLRTALSIPQSIIQRFPTIAFFIYWSISFVKYNEFKSLFLENANKPEAYHFEDRNHSHIKSTEYKKFVKNDFIAIPKETEKSNQASILQCLLFFALFDLVSVPKLERLSFSSTKNKELVEKFKDALMAPEMDWRNPKTQLEQLNELLKNNDLPTVTKNVDFRLFDGKANEKGFSQTESAVNLIYNIITFTSINPENGIVQQVNHLDELRDRTFEYHNEKITSWNNVDEPKQTLYKDELDKLQSIDCGFEIKDVSQTKLTNRSSDVSRDFKCKAFSETDTSCVPTTTDYKPYRQLYRTMLSTLYINFARNMFVHYAPFKSTETLLDVRNFNDLLGILYDVKDRIENESVLYSVAKTYEDFKFIHKRAFAVDGKKESLNQTIEKTFDIVLGSGSLYLKYIAENNDIINPIDISDISKANDPVFKSVYEKTKGIIGTKKLKSLAPECFGIAKSKKDEFVKYIAKQWNKKDYREIIISLNCLKEIFSRIYWYSLPSEKPTPDEKNLHRETYCEIEAWESFFVWQTVRRDMESAKKALGKLDYFEKDLAKAVDLESLDKYSQLGDYDLCEKEIKKIAKQLPSFILFKNIYSRRNDFGTYKDYDFSLSDNDDELRHYQWYKNDINEIAKEKDTKEMKEYLEFIEYEVLRNEYYYPNSPKYKIDFIEFLADIDSLIESNFTAPDLIAISKKVSEKAQERLAEAKKEVDPQSIAVFENAPTYDIRLLEITKSLLQRTICYLTSLEEIRTKLNEKPLLNVNGQLPFSRNDLYGDKRRGVIGIKESLELKMYEKPLRDDLQKFLNFIFGIIGHYERDSEFHETEKTLLDLYGYRFFLYLIRVTFEMSQSKDFSNKES